MEDSFFFVGLLLSDIALGNQVVVLSLILKKVEVHFLIGFLVMFFKEHHIFLKIVFVFFHIFKYFFLVLGRVEDLVLHFLLLLAGLNFSRCLDDRLKLSADKEFSVDRAE